MTKTKKKGYFIGRRKSRRRRRRRQYGGYWSGTRFPPNNSNTFHYNTFQILQRYKLYNHNRLPQDVVISGVSGMIYYADGNPITIAPNQYLITKRGAGTDGERRVVSLAQINSYQDWIPDGKEGPGGAGPRTPRSGHGSGGRRRRKSCKRRRKKRTRRRKSR